MSTNIGRTADGWWVETRAGMIPLDLAAPTTGALLGDRDRVESAVAAARRSATEQPGLAVPAKSLHLLAPVTAPARVVAQMVNYRSHARDSGMKPDRVAVELNLDIVPRTQWETTTLKNRDKLEVVHFVGGGCTNLPNP